VQWQILAAMADSELERRSGLVFLIVSTAFRTSCGREYTGCSPFGDCSLNREAHNANLSNRKLSLGRFGVKEIVLVVFLHMMHREFTRISTGFSTA
jgi:hypothetical protein